MCANDKYRTRLIQLYRRCLVTGYDSVQCDAAHIIPQYICYRFSLQDLVDDIYNGLILTKDLHCNFDKYLWCFDVHGIKWEDESLEWCHIPIIVYPNKKKLTINQYEGQFIKVPVRSLPFLWVDYQVYMMINYQGGKIKEKYQTLLGSDEYLQLLENPRRLAQTGRNANNSADQNATPAIIVGKRRFGYEYQVIFRSSAWSLRAWVRVETIPPYLITIYENFNTQSDDPDWKPPRSL